MPLFFRRIVNMKWVCLKRCIEQKTLFVVINFAVARVFRQLGMQCGIATIAYFMVWMGLSHTVNIASLSFSQAILFPSMSNLNVIYFLIWSNCHSKGSPPRKNTLSCKAIAALRAARPSRIMGQWYSQAGTFWGVLNVSLLAYGAQLRSRLGWFHKQNLIRCQVDTVQEVVAITM